MAAKDLEAEELEVIELLVMDLPLYKDVQSLHVLHQHLRSLSELEELEDQVQDILQTVVQDLKWSTIEFCYWSTFCNKCNWWRIPYGSDLW